MNFDKESKSNFIFSGVGGGGGVGGWGGGGGGRGVGGGCSVEEDMPVKLCPGYFFPFFVRCEGGRVGGGGGGVGRAGGGGRCWQGSGSNYFRM